MKTPLPDKQNSRQPGEETASPQLVVARQPIFDRGLNVVAYELLFRNSAKNIFEGREENDATATVIYIGFYSSDASEILDGKPAFINFPRKMLLEGGGPILPKEHTVIEILESVIPDSEIIEACRQLKAQGYRLALDDFVPHGPHGPLVPMADILKVDFRATTPAEQAAIAGRYGGSTSLLAEKVETREEFERALDLGFSLLQGFFFARPVIIASREIPGFKLNYLRILKEIHQPEVNFDQLGALFYREPGLSYKLLKFVNSVAFASRMPIESVGHALVYLGEVEIKKWISLVALPSLASDKPSELLVSALLRARFCELVAPRVHLSQNSTELFLVGLFSLIDAMLGRPLEELLQAIALPEAVRQVLLGQAGSGERMARAWEMVLAYEAADWATTERLVESLDIAMVDLALLYYQAIKWANQVFGATVARPSNAGRKNRP